MKVIVIGAGASGLAAALEAAKRGYKVIVLELKNEAGKKIYSTGNGRCNITNKKWEWNIIIVMIMIFRGNTKGIYL